MRILVDIYQYVTPPRANCVIKPTLKTQFKSFGFIAIKSTMSAKVEILLGPWGPGKWWHGAEFGRKIENL